MNKSIKKAVKTVLYRPILSSTVLYCPVLSVGVNEMLIQNPISAVPELFVNIELTICEKNQRTTTFPKLYIYNSINEKKRFWEAWCPKTAFFNMFDEKSRGIARGGNCYGFPSALFISSIFCPSCLFFTFFLYPSSEDAIYTFR